MNLTSAYSRFTAEERAKLTLAATVRQDTEEALRLMKSCPRKTYDILDPDYLTPVLMVQLFGQDVIISWVDCSCFVLLNAALETPALKQWSSMWLGIEAGMKGFCAAVGLNWDEVLAWAYRQTVSIEPARRVLHVKARPNVRLAEAIRRRLLGALQPEDGKLQNNFGAAAARGEGGP